MVDLLEGLFTPLRTRLDLSCGCFGIVVALRHAQVGRLFRAGAEASTDLFRFEEE